MGSECYGVVRFDLGPLLQGQKRIAKLKKCVQLTDYWSFRFGMVNQHGKSWAGNLLVFKDLTLGPSFKVK